MPKGIDAYRRNGGVHSDQYRTPKQARLDAQTEIDQALAEQADEDRAFFEHAAGIGADFLEEDRP